MNVSLASSLHFSHGDSSPDRRPGDPLRMLDFVPMGLLCLKSYVEQQAIEAAIRVVELNQLINAGHIPNDRDFYEHLTDVILGPEDDLVGLMTDADSLHHTVILAKLIKRRRPGALVCLGGPASTPIGSLILDSFPFIDFVVRGEGEEIFAELLEALGQRRPLDPVQGLTWRRGTKAVENPSRRLEADLDRFPMPDFNAFDMSSGAPLYLDVGRGCPFKCQFCATAPFWKQEFRMKSIGRIIAEMVLLRDRFGRNHANFSHDIFTCDRAWTLQFCETLIQEPIGVTWSCSTRTDIIKPDLLEVMAQAGCVEIFYGIETGSEEMQQKIQKNLDLDWSREIIRATSAAGIRPVTGFIAGYPMETRETFRDTLTRYFEFLEVGGFRSHIFTLKPYHESPLYRKFGADRLERPSEYFDLPLAGFAGQESQKMKLSHPEVFSAYFRYATPGVEGHLIDATEEISAQLVLLRSIWPLLLKYYADPLEVFERWVHWIGAYNEIHRPGTLHRHQSDVEDLLAFVEEEVRRLGCDDPALSAMIRYEKLKVSARSLPPLPSQTPEVSIDENTIVQGGQGYVAAELDHDIRPLIGRPSEEDDGRRWVLVTNSGEKPLALRRWVLVAKADGASLNTYHVGSAAMRLLELSAEPERVGDLIHRMHQDLGGDREAGQDLKLVQDLVAIRLLRPLQVV